MRKLVRVIIAFVAVMLLIGGILFVVNAVRKKGAGVSIETTPSATVLINGEQVGRTPYQAVLDPGEIVVKLIPDSFEKPLAPYETKITLVPDVQTSIKREFGETEDLSSGVLVSYEKVGSGETSISVVSIPDAAQVSLDGNVRGFTPYKTASVVKGEHQLTVTASGFVEKSLSVKAVDGYKLTSVFKLIPSGEQKVEEPKAEEPVVEEKEELVEILDTGTGFLRVRAGPATSDLEVGRVEPKKQYQLIEKDEDKGWFKIEYEKGKEGWVTNQFAKIVEAKASPSPTPKPKATP